jgi:hypothetical protein
MPRERDLSGMPNQNELLAEARRIGWIVQPIPNSGERLVITPYGRLRLNARRKEGVRALRNSLRRYRTECTR